MVYQNGIYTPYTPYAGYSAQPNPAYQQYAPQQPMLSQMAQQQTIQQNVQQQVQQSSQPQQTAQTQPVFVNKVLVTGKTDAEMRQVPFNSEAVYIHQSKPFGFQVYTDPQGRKETTIFRLVPCDEKELEDETTIVSQATLANYATVDDLKSGLAELESKLVQHIKQATAKKKRVVVEEDDEDDEEEEQCLTS